MHLASSNGALSFAKVDFLMATTTKGYTLGSLVPFFAMPKKHAIITRTVFATKRHVDIWRLVVGIYASPTLDRS